MIDRERKERMELINQILAAKNDLDGLGEICDKWDDISKYLQSTLSPNAYQVIEHAINASADAIHDYIIIRKARIKEIESDNNTDD